MIFRIFAKTVFSALTLTLFLCSFALAAESGTLEPSNPKSGKGSVKAEVDREAPKAPALKPNKGVPVKITAQRMVYDEAGKTVAFIGDVRAEHEGLVLTSEKVTAYFTGEKQYQVSGIAKIEASGNVKVVRGKIQGTCGILTYQVEQRLLIMSDKPELREGQNSITGDQIKFYVRENRSEVVGGKDKRVEAIFFTPQGLKVN